MKKIIYTKDAPEPIGPYSQAVLTTNNLIFISGQIPIDPSANKIISNDIETQTKQVLYNIDVILKTQNMDQGNLIKCEVYLKNLSDFDKFNKIYEKYFEDHEFPARVVVEVTRLPKDSLIEISAIAAVS